MVFPLAPVSPRGIVKSNLAAPEVPELLTEAELPARPVLVELTTIVAAAPVGPCGPIKETPTGHVPETLGPNIVFVVMFM